MENKKVTLNNGTVLEVGKTYEFDKFERCDYFKVMFIGDYLMYYKYNASGDEVSMRITKDLMILPYTPPTPQKEWKTFLIEWEKDIENPESVDMQQIARFKSFKDCQRHFYGSYVKSITEVKLNIEPVTN